MTGAGVDRADLPADTHGCAFEVVRVVTTGGRPEPPDTPTDRGGVGVGAGGCCAPVGGARLGRNGMSDSFTFTCTEFIKRTLLPSTNIIRIESDNIQ